MITFIVFFTPKTDVFLDGYFRKVKYNRKQMCKIILLIMLLIFVPNFECKYMEGVLTTSENWAFLARFCFLSEEGQFEYEIVYNEDQGDPNLLLYYDTDDQWPAVYKSNKTCQGKEAVLNIRQNQIVNLTARLNIYDDLAGCSFLLNGGTSTTPRSKYTSSKPTLPVMKVSTKKGTIRLSPSTTEEISTTIEYSTTISTTISYLEITTGTDTTTEMYSTENLLSNSYLITENAVEDTSPWTTGVEPVSIEDIKKAPIKKRSLPTSKRPNWRDIRKDRTVFCHNARRFKSSRERWWFIAISNCNGTKGIDIKYKILMTNGPPGDYWHEHFSADEFYILPVLMAFSIAYSFLMLGVVMCSVELRSRQLLHTTYKIFVLSALLQLFAILFQSACYLTYAVSGVPAVKVKRLGAVLMGASETCFLLLLLLLAKGYTITRGRLPLPASVKLTIFMCIYVVTYITIFIYEAKVFDPGEVLYLYESPAGYSLIILRVVAWFMFIYSTIFTLKHYPEKGNFYYPFNIFGTVWFIAGPAFIVSANTYIDKWVRESVVCAVLLFIIFGGHLMFLILTMPSVANKNFPYHVRTTQIGIMETTGPAGTSTIEQFGHHVYEPSGILREQTVIIPLTRRTEEIFESMYNQQAFRRNNLATSDQANLEQQNNARDITIENVLSWSLAKNVPTIELPNFERVHNRSSTTSTNSKNSECSNLNNILSRRPSFTRGNHETSNFDDYVREVPVELFTVSRMTVTKNTTARNASETE